MDEHKQVHAAAAHCYSRISWKKKVTFFSHEIFFTRLQNHCEFLLSEVDKWLDSRVLSAFSLCSPWLVLMFMKKKKSHCTIHKRKALNSFCFHAGRSKSKERPSTASSTPCVLPPLISRSNLRDSEWLQKRSNMSNEIYLHRHRERERERAKRGFYFSFSK